MRDKLASEGITSEIYTGIYQNITFKNAKDAEYSFDTSILERYSGNQCVYHWEEGDGKIKTQHTDELQDDNHESATANGMFTKLEKL